MRRGPGGHGRMRILVVLVAFAAACGGPSPAPSAAPATPSATAAAIDHDTAYALGLEAYVYGLPLLVMDATFKTMTSVDVAVGACGPVNQFNHVRSPNTASSTAVVAPGATSLSSIAWLDLRDEPQVLHVPEVVDHHFVLALLDPYTENLRNLGDAAGTAPGDYVIAGPGQHTMAIPAGTERISVDATRIWIIGSTQLKGEADMAAVNAIQDHYTLTPLHAYGTSWAPDLPKTPDTTVDKATLPGGLASLDALGALLAAFPPPPADAPVLARLATVGIGPGRTPSTDPSLTEATRQGLADAVAAGPDAVRAAVVSTYKAGFRAHNGYLLGGFGTYGTDYTLRAVIASIGLGAFTADQAVYAMAWADAAGATLNGASPYVLQLGADPPSRQGWSLTVYGADGALVANPYNRYALTDTSGLPRAADGSIRILLQPSQPEDQEARAAWIPTPAGQTFHVVWRLFAPEATALAGILDGTGWQPPAIVAGG